MTLSEIQDVIISGSEKNCSLNRPYLSFYMFLLKKTQKTKNLQTLARKIPQNLEMPTCMDLKAL
jgi:hypothetical protein